MKLIRILAGPVLLLLLAVIAAEISAAPAAKAEPHALSRGQTVYVPVYANVFSAPRKLIFHLSTILSIRNTDLSRSLTVLSADYYDTRGRKVKTYYQKPVVVAPLESIHIYIGEDDAVGGEGANFIVRWTANEEINAPIIESVMIGMKTGQGISFVGQGKVIGEH